MRTTNKRILCAGIRQKPGAWQGRTYASALPPEGHFALRMTDHGPLGIVRVGPTDFHITYSFRTDGA